MLGKPQQKKNGARVRPCNVKQMAPPARATISQELRLLAAGRGFNFQVVAGQVFFRFFSGLRAR